MDSGIRCHNYRYTVTQVLISVKCFLGSSAGFRGLSSVFYILKEWISPFIAPAYTTIRQWILKIGLYKLNCPKYSSSGWFFVVDTSIQMGAQKCVVILGLEFGHLSWPEGPKIATAQGTALGKVRKKMQPERMQ
jgi:hypothetical protein